MQARQLSELGLDAWQQGQGREAERMFAQAVACCPNDAAARCHLADCLWQRGAADQAIEQLSRAVELMEYGDVGLLVQLGQMHLEAGSLTAASELAERATRLDPLHAAAWRLHGSVLERQGQPNDALDSYYRSLSYDAYQSETLLAVAEVYQQLGRPSRTLATLNQLDRQCGGAELPQRVWILRALAQQELQSAGRSPGIAATCLPARASHRRSAGATRAASVATRATGGGAADTPRCLRLGHAGAAGVAAPIDVSAGSAAAAARRPGTALKSGRRSSPCFDDWNSVA